MANRVTPFTNIETLSGNISAQTYFDNNIGPAFTSLNDASLGYVNGVLVDSGSANNYVVTCNFGTPSAYNQGMRLTIKPANSNTGASNITVSPLTSVSILRPDGTACIGGEIVANVDIDMTFNGTAFVITALPWVPVSVALGSIATNQTVNCQNASSVAISFSIAAANLSITLTNLAIGVYVGLFCFGSTTTTAFFPAAKNPAGTSYTSTFLQQGISGTQTGYSITSGKMLFSSGAAQGSNFFLLGVQSL